MGFMYSIAQYNTLFSSVYGLAMLVEFSWWYVLRDFHLTSKVAVDVDFHFQVQIRFRFGLVFDVFVCTVQYNTAQRGFRSR